MITFSFHIEETSEKYYRIFALKVLSNDDFIDSYSIDEDDIMSIYLGINNYDEIMKKHHGIFDEKKQHSIFKNFTYAVEALDEINSIYTMRKLTMQV